MRASLIGMFTALGIGLIGPSGAVAVPANGTAQLGTESLMQNVALKAATVKKVKIFRSRRVCVRWVVRRHHIRPTSRFLVRRVCVRWLHR